MSEPIVTFNNRTLRVEGDGWLFEVRALASGKQLFIRTSGSIDGSAEMRIRPAETGMVFISSRASEQAEENEILEGIIDAENTTATKAAQPNSSNRRSAKR